jgi:hypothetical protein
MNDSKNLAMMFLLGAFLTGGVLGFTADRYMSHERADRNGRSNAALMRIMSERLRLSDQQQKSIDSILDQRSRQYRAVMEPVRPRLDSIKLNAREQMRRVLSQEQKEQFEALIEEMNDSTRKRNDE